MNYKILKEEYINLKKEELEYIDNIFKLSRKEILSELKKLEIYRNLNNYTNKLNEILKQIKKEITNNKEIIKENNKIIIEFNIDKNYLSNIDYYEKEYLFNNLGININTLKFKINNDNLYINEYIGINSFEILTKQSLINNSIYIFDGYKNETEDCYGPCFDDLENYIYGIYKDIKDNNFYIEIPQKEKDDFEKDKIIIKTLKYVSSKEISNIFKEELLNNKNYSINDCITNTRNKIEKLNYIRSPEYKEKILLDKINNLYQKVKGKYIKKEILYKGDFLKMIKETYILPNNKIIKKEKIIKNDGKDSVIVIAITQEKDYIITFQNRINNTKIAEFPSGYIEKEENPIDAAKRELQEETGYISDDIFIIDEAYTSPGIDNSKSYIVIANNCIKSNNIKNNSNELISYGLFSETELKYLVNNNIINGAMNKLAYYNLINNVDDCNIINNNKKIYKKTKVKK